MRPSLKFALLTSTLWFLMSVPQVFAQAATPSITGITPAIFSQGDVVEISGINLGATEPKENPIICFTQSQCTVASSFPKVLRSWTMDKIVIQVPNWDIPETGEILILVQPDPATKSVPVKSPVFSFVNRRSSITSVSPIEAVTRETIVTITGIRLGPGFEKGKDEYCVDKICIKPEFVDSFIKSWSDTEAKVTLPFVETLDPVVVTILKWKFIQLYDNKPIYDVLKSQPIKLIPQKNPEITGFSPLVVVPGQTVVTVTGSGFEEAYKPDLHQLCFENLCMLHAEKDRYISSWSESKIQFTVPSFVSQFDTASFSMRLFFPNQQAYIPTKYQQVIEVRKAPFIERYYLKMETGDSYSISGKNFGDLQGKVWVGNRESKIKAWSNVEITFEVPLIAGTQDLVVENTNGVRSLGLPVEIIFVKRYSEDPLSDRLSYFDLMRIGEAWTITEGAAEVVVAVLDSGVDKSHEELQGSLWFNTKEVPGNGVDDDQNGFVDDVNGWNFVDNTNVIDPVNEHGTMVASIIAAKKNNGKGFTGIAPNVKIMVVKVAKATPDTQEQHKITLEAVQKGIKYAVDNGAHVLNLSFGGAYSESYSPAIEYAYQNNVLVVAAAGNNAKDIEKERQGPVCNDGLENRVIGVSALTKEGILASFSNFGAKCIDLAAPGAEIVVATPDYLNDKRVLYSLAGGTSFAAPFVSGIAALMKSHHPDWNVEEIKTVLLSTARNIDEKNPAVAGKLGRGLIDAYAALIAPKPSVFYQFTPRRTLTITKTNEVISMEDPNLKPIMEEKPVKTPESAMKPEGEIKMELGKEELKKEQEPPGKLSPKEKRQERLKKAQEKREQEKKKKALTKPKKLTPKERRLERLKKKAEL